MRPAEIIRVSRTERIMMKLNLAAPLVAGAVLAAALSLPFAVSAQPALPTKDPAKPADTVVGGAS